MIDLEAIFRPYNPWWSDPTSSLGDIPKFHRPIFELLVSEIDLIPQILSITGPRRIGKSTLLQQLIRHFISQGVAPQRIVYYSFDDPSLIAQKIKVDELIDSTMKMVVKRESKDPTYLFLDEIQRLDRWELYLKKYYDLKYPIRVVISGSASSPIFKKSRESLLGRVKDYHLLPFSFREFVLYFLRENQELCDEVNELSEAGKRAQGMFTEDPAVQVDKVTIHTPSSTLSQQLDELLKRYLLEGGFPEVWSLPHWVAKQEYLYDNQVKKVIYEDLVLAAEFRKPELLKRFYVSLLEMPGREINVQSVAKETSISSLQIEKYLPLLELTDLVYRISKFRAGPLRIRKGLMKFYLVDLALRNAVLRLNETLLRDDSTLGLYAENLVFLALKKWRGTIQMDYYRDRHEEVDFIVHVGPHKFLPVEVKYRNEIHTDDFNGLKKFGQKFGVSAQPIMVTKRWEDFGKRENAFLLPMPLFLLLFD
ncbi:MAG: ATP-binding protein [Ignavibacteriae bacterium]|nr:ATP-binding protein [Ignavibacteriota bacterium]